MKEKIWNYVLKKHMLYAFENSTQDNKYQYKLQWNCSFKAREKKTWRVLRQKDQVTFK